MNDWRAVWEPAQSSDDLAHALGLMGFTACGQDASHWPPQPYLEWVDAAGWCWRCVQSIATGSARFQ